MIVDGRTLRPPLWWNAGDVGTRRRKNLGTRAAPVLQPPRMFVWHWSGGASRTALGVYRTLRRRRLAVHWIIESAREGRIVQCADPATTVCYHAGPLANERSEGCEVCGGPRRDFTAAQYAAIGELADLVAMPSTSGLVGAFPRPIRRALFNVGDSIATFEGHLEHRNITGNKIDAGGRALHFLAERWGLPPPAFVR